MTTLTKLMLRTFFLSGLSYASIMAGFNYFSDQEFNIWKFLIHFIVFGLMMSFIARYNHNKQ